MTATGPVVDITDVQFRWPGRSSFGLSIPTLSLSQGETVLLLGESGSGKSTLLSLISGTVQADAGKVTVSGKELASLTNGQRDQLRAEQIGVIFQQFNLLPFGTVLDNILLPLRFAPSRKKRVSDPHAEALHLCTALGLPNLLHMKAGTLSVGQQQRVAVARALIGGPPIILADEPTSALDETSRSAFLDLLFDQISQRSTSLLMVSHDPRIADRFHRTLQLEDIVQTERSDA